MPPNPDPATWVVLGEPASPAEQQALTAFQNLLPSDGITRAWANLTFVDGKGRTGEVDVLLLSPVGFFLVELKGWHGVITGTTQRWEQRHPTTDALIRSHPNPYVAADSKAKRLSSILKDYLPNDAARRELPFLKSLVVLHGQDSIFAIEDPAARANVLSLNGYRVTTPSNVAPLTDLATFLATPPAYARDDVDARRAAVVNLAVTKAHLVPTPKVRRFGQYAVTERTPIAEGPTWQDVLVENTGLGEKRRLRIFDLPPSASEEERQRVKEDASREVALTKGLHHPGITVPLDFIGTDTGPALVFAYDDGERPLDSFLAERSANLTMDERMALVRQLGNTLRYAHDRRLVHRSLSPKHVWIRPDSVRPDSARPDAAHPAAPELTVRDWYAGQKRRSTSSTAWTALSAGVSDVAKAVVQEDWLYLAPEALRGGDDLPGIPLDVYGFAALAALILTGRPPVASVNELVAAHQADGGINLGAQDSLPESVIEAVLAATRTTESERTASVREVLDALEASWTPEAPEDDAVSQPTPAPADPLAAQPGDLVADRFSVVARRGEGSSGTAFVVTDSERPDAKPAILKIAKNDVAAVRLDVEADVLRTLRHPRIVALTQGPIDLGSRRALLLTDAGSETLSARIDREGRATIGQLESFGTDLLDLATYLDTQGTFHRDIKPANLGISVDAKSSRRRLTLFDFSLAREPLDNTGSGTRGYLDPYLGRGARSRYDRAAELWTVSATLFELATGEVPWWGTGSAPADLTDPPVVSPEAFEQSVASRLVPFFTKALAPDAKRRFGSVDELRTAWLDVFAGLDSSDSARDGDDAAAAQAELTTPLEASGLSARALSGLARTEAHTVGELLAVPATQINSIPGLGEVYRKEIQRRIKAWRHDLGATDAAQQGPGAVESVLTDALSDLPTASLPVVRALLGLDGAPWPTAAEVAQSQGLTRTAVVEHLDRAIGKWRNNRSVDLLTDEVLTHLARRGRVLLADDVALALAAQHGSTLDGAARLAQSAALVRVVTEVALAAPDPQLQTKRRRDARPLLVLTEASDPDEVGAAFPAAEDLVEAAEVLARTADSLVVAGQVVPQAEAEARLRESVTEELGHDPLPAASDVTRLAAGLASSAAASGLGELYPRDLSLETALEVALRARPGRAISVDWLRGRLATRFPQLTAPLPDGAALDRLVAGVLPGMVRKGTVFEPSGSGTSRSTSTRSTVLGGGPGVAEVGVLRRSLATNSALTLSVRPSQHAAAIAELERAFGVTVLDVAARAVAAARALAAERGIRWPVALAADAEDATSRGGQQLARLMSDAVATFWDDALATTDPLLLVFPGPLVRYGLAERLSSLLDVATSRPAARWLLVPRETSVAVPMLEGQPVPLGPSTWHDLPPLVDLEMLPTASESQPPPPAPPGTSTSRTSPSSTPPSSTSKPEGATA